MKKDAVLILDDDELYRLELEMILQGYHYDIWLSAGSSQEVIEKLAQSAEQPEVMLLDVRLKENLDGINLASQLKAKHIPCIFLTAFPEEEQFQRALATKPSAYFIKPVKALELHHAIQLALNNPRADDKGVTPSASNAEALAQDHLTLKDKDNIIRDVAIAQIHVVESYGNLLLFHTRGNRFLLRTPLKEMEDLLKPHGFIRIHRRYLISLRHWEKKWPLGTVLFVAGNKYPIGRSYRKKLLCSLNKIHPG